MNEVTNRLLAFYDYLKTENIVTGQSDFAQRIGISASMFTEISKGRSNPGLNVIQKTVKSFPDLNSDWLLTGEGDMITQKNAHTPDETDVFSIVSEPETANIPTRKPPIASPNQGKNASPTASPTQNVTPTLVKNVTPTVTPTPEFGMPKVVTVDKLGRDNVVLVPVKARAGYLLGYGDPEYVSELPSYHLPGLQNGTFRAFEVEGHSMVPTVQKGDIVVGEWVEGFDFITDDRVYVIVTRDAGILVKRVLNRISKYGFIIAKSDAIANRSAYPNININPADVVEMWYVRMKLSTDLSSPSDLWDRVNDLEATVEVLRMDIQKITPEKGS